MTADPNRGQQGFLDVVGDLQSYVNILYLLVSFPLGIFYFVFLVTGLALGFGLSITLLGIPILVLVLWGSWVLCQFERHLAIALLQENIPAMARLPQERGLWNRIKSLLKDSRTWTGLFYLFIKFPLGIASFTLVVALLSTSLALIGAPIVIQFIDVNFVIWVVDTLPEALACTLVGTGLLIISLHTLNGLAVLSGLLARGLLGENRSDAR